VHGGVKIKFFLLVLRGEKLPSWSGVKLPKLWVATSPFSILEQRPFFESFPLGKPKNTQKVSSNLYGFQIESLTGHPERNCQSTREK
jgi:hypothetical protein